MDFEKMFVVDYLILNFLDYQNIEVLIFLIIEVFLYKLQLIHPLLVLELVDKMMNNNFDF